METTEPTDLRTIAPVVQVGRLAHLATLGVALAHLLDEQDFAGDAAMTATLEQLRAASRDEIGELVVSLTALLDEGDEYALVDSLTVEQAARALGVRPNTVYKAIEGGRLPATREGGRVRIRPADLRAYRAQPRQPGGRPRKGGES